MRRRLLTATLALILATGAAGVAGAARIKPDTPAKASGRCMSSVVLFSKMSEASLGKSTPMYDEMVTTWAAHISAHDQTFQDAAKAESRVALQGYSAAKEKGGEDALFAAVTGDLARCIEYETG